MSNAAEKLADDKTQEGVSVLQTRSHPGKNNFKWSGGSVWGRQKNEWKGVRLSSEKPPSLPETPS